METRFCVRRDMVLWIEEEVRGSEGGEDILGWGLESGRLWNDDGCDVFTGGEGLGADK